MRNNLSDERKRLQESGDIPEWFSTGSWQMFKKKYLYGVTTAREQYQRIADTAAKHLPEVYRHGGGSYSRDAIAFIFFQMMWNGWLSPSTPILSNMGTDRGLPVSCAGSYIDDSIDGIYKSRHETAMLTKMGFGTAGYVGDIRPRGSAISGGGTSYGVLPVMESFWADMDYVAQGSARRGSWAGYLPLSHGDFYEVCERLFAAPNGRNVGWCVSNKELEELNAGCSDMIDRYQEAMKTKMTTGKGYWFFPDKTNAKRPATYVKHDLKISAPQLCLTYDTRIEVSPYSDGTDSVIIELGALCELWPAMTGDLFVHAHDLDTSKDVFARITDAGLTGMVDEYVSVSSEFDTIKSTIDHPVYVESRGYVPASNLNLDDELLSPDGYLNDVTRLEYVECEYKIPVYDITVEGCQNFYANNILVHNCNEITLFNDENHTYTCVLASMNASKYDEWKDTDSCYWATVFLDCVVSEFLERARGIPGLEKAVRCTEKGRALGLGVMGYQTYLLDKRIPFESFDAHLFNEKLFKQMRSQAETATSEMASQLGEPEWCEGFGRRNTHLISVAPTKSTSIMMGGVSEGISPVGGFVFTQRTPAGEIQRIDPSLLALMKEKGVYNDDVVMDVRDHEGSVQHVDWLSSDEKRVFKNAFELDQHVLVREASFRSRWIDQWQSLNLFFAADVDAKIVNDVHAHAFFDPNILGLYYVNSTRNPLGEKKDGECEACQ